MIKAIIFDCDGLLIDTETAWYSAVKDVYFENGLDLPLELYAACIGTSMDHFDPYKHLAESLNKPDHVEHYKTIGHGKHLTLMEKEILRPGVLNYLKSAKEMGLRIGLASSSTRSWVESYLRAYEILDYFDTIHTADLVQKVKPDPELYLQALSALGVAGEEAIAFEDSLNGLTAAKAAGMFCVIVPNEVTSFMNFINYELRLHSMEEFSLQEVIARIEGLKNTG